MGLALAFVVAELSCSADPQKDGVSYECRSFLGELKNSPAGLESLESDAYIFLRQKLDEFCGLQSWVGVQCEECGMWATRPAVLEEHRLICASVKQLEGMPNSIHGVSNPQQPLRLTASDLAARPMRGNNHTHA